MEETCAFWPCPQELQLVDDIVDIPGGDPGQGDGKHLTMWGVKSQYYHSSSPDAAVLLTLRGNTTDDPCDPEPAKLAP